MKKYTKIIFWTLSAVLLIFLLIVTADGIISSKAEKAINGAQMNGRKLSAGKVTYRILGGSLRIKDLKLEGNDSIPGSSIKKIIVKGIGLSDIKGKNITLRSVTIDTPDITVYLKKREENKQKNKRKISVNKLSVKNGNLNFHIPDAVDMSVLNASNLNLTAEGLSIDSVFNGPSMIKMNMDSLSYLFSGEEYTLKAKNITADSRKGTFGTESIGLVSFYPKYEFAYHSRGHRDWITFSSGRTELHGLDYDRLFSDKAIITDSIYVEEGYVESYKNRKIPVPDRDKPMFQDMIHKIPIAVSAKVIQVSNFEARYDELAVNGITPGVITFDDINAKLSDFSNVPDSISFITINAEGMLMGSSRINVKYYLPKEEGDPRFMMYGEWEKGEIAPMNRMVEPLADIKVVSGYNDGMKFKVIGDNYESRTNLTFLYHDLEVAMMKNDLRDEKGFLTGIANLIIRHQNPDENGKTHEGEATTERNPYRSNFNYMWKSVFNGVKKTVL